ncbi:MAG TPA: hypothetical protein VJ878_00225, partial [Candidatus Izemoplasmatales bacterium]|nr:hypothetical protein [Candidatus Izemoplasmatales bacterium]
RYVDRYVTVNQGEVFFMTEALSVLEGIERGPAGNTSLAAAFSLAQTMPEDQIILVQETEYTSAGKHHQAQLAFARDNGICIYFGNPQNEIPGKSIVFPKEISMIKAVDLDLTKLKTKYIHNHLKDIKKVFLSDLEFLSIETNTSLDFVKNILNKLNIELEATHE